MISEETRVVYAELSKDASAAWLHLDTFRDLYASDPSSVDLLNEIASGAFRVIQECLRDSVVLRITRLVDREKLFGMENLVLESLIGRVEQDGEAGLAKELRDAYEDVLARVKPVRKMRNKLTSHTDASVRLRVAPMPTVTLEELDSAVKSIFSFLRLFERTATGGATAYELSFLEADAKTLLRRLREAVAYRKEVPDWYMRGNPRRQWLRDLQKEIEAQKI